MKRHQHILETPSRKTRSSGPPPPHEPLNTSRNKKTRSPIRVQVSSLIPTLVDLHIGPPDLTPIPPLEESQEDTEPRLPPILQRQDNTHTAVTMTDTMEQKIQEILGSRNEVNKQQNEDDRRLREKDLREMNELKAQMDRLNHEEEARKTTQQRRCVQIDYFNNT